MALTRTAPPSRLTSAVLTVEMTSTPPGIGIAWVEVLTAPASIRPGTLIRAAELVLLWNFGPSIEDAAVRAEVIVLFAARTMEPPDQPTISYTEAPAGPAVTT